MTVPPSISRLTSQDILDEDSGITVMDYSSGAPTVWTDGNGNLTASSFQGNAFLGTPQAIVTGNTLTIPANMSVVPVTVAAACTGVIFPAGTRPGQMLIVVNKSAAANTITFAAQGTSLVAGGAAVSIAGLAAHLFIWESVSGFWYQVGPLAN